MRVFVQQENFSVSDQYASLVRSCPGAAVVTFTGHVRDFCADSPVSDSAIVGLELEHYPGMTESVLKRIGREAAERFALREWRIVHRFGVLAFPDPIVWVGVVADHRGPAFDGCQFIMDALKTDAPFWKKEHWGNGMATWVEARAEDDQRRERWQHSN